MLCSKAKSIFFPFTLSSAHRLLLPKSHAKTTSFVKVFPTAGLGSSYIKAVRGPLNHIRLLAVGGVNEKNIAEFLAAGCVGAGVGGNLVNKTWIANGEWDKITALAKEFIANANA